MSDHRGLRVDRDDGVLTVTFDRPAQHNAMTWAMYDGLVDACETADSDEGVRVLVLRGGEKAFIAGTDISHFTGFDDGSEGIAYERSIARVVNRLEEVDVPTVAAIRGFCLGGGLLLAGVCDIRIGTPSARIGLPIARTLGNCVSMNSWSILESRLGSARALDLLLRARILTGEEASAAGFLAELCAEEALDDAVATLTSELVSGAPLTQWAAKEMARRLRRASLPEGDDVVARAYGSADFRRAAGAFADKETVSWQGR